MRGEIKSIISPDLNEIKQLDSETDNDFCVLWQIMVGPAGEDMSESFDIVICSLSWVDGYLAKNNIIFPRHYLIVREYNYQLIYDFINRYITICTGDNWEAVAQQISRLGKWEFEDYVDPR